MIFLLALFGLGGCRILGKSWRCLKGDCSWSFLPAYTVCTDNATSALRVIIVPYVRTCTYSKRTMVIKCILITAVDRWCRLSPQNVILYSLFQGESQQRLYRNLERVLWPYSSGKRFSEMYPFLSVCITCALDYSFFLLDFFSLTRYSSFHLKNSHLFKFVYIQPICTFSKHVCNIFKR